MKKSGFPKMRHFAGFLQIRSHIFFIYKKLVVTFKGENLAIFMDLTNFNDIIFTVLLDDHCRCHQYHLTILV